LLLIYYLFINYYRRTQRRF